MKKTIQVTLPAIFLVFCLILTLSGCNAISQAFCAHEFTEATCTESQTCTKCGKTEGDPLGHDWVDATCGDPKTCERCGETEGEPTGDHTWVEATCTEPKTCSVCGTTEGDALGHDWIAATYEEPKTCARCGLTEGEPLELSITEKFPGGVSRVSGDAFTFNQEEFEALFDDALNYTDRVGGMGLVLVTDDEDSTFYGIESYQSVYAGSVFISKNSEGYVQSVIIQGPGDADDPEYPEFLCAVAASIYVCDASYSDGSIPDTQIFGEIGDVFENLDYLGTGSSGEMHALTQNGLEFVLTFKTTEDNFYIMIDDQSATSAIP